MRSSNYTESTMTTFKARNHFLNTRSKCDGLAAVTNQKQERLSLNLTSMLLKRLNA